MIPYTLQNKIVNYIHLPVFANQLIEEIKQDEPEN